mmetsp:Transcript_89900/g.279297  ORF Transcript_89900/g.279297 Transcript_89900/m.279297 type:complete len:119 (-) Transcript_89900:33-389(-)
MPKPNGRSGLEGEEGSDAPLPCQPPEGAPQPVVEVAIASLRATVTSMSLEAYHSLACGKAGAPPGLTAGELAEAVERAGELPWRDPQAGLRKLPPPAKGRGAAITAAAFAEFVWEACK